MAKFVPNLLTAEILKKLGVPTETFNASFADMMRAGVERVMGFQSATGGWGWYGPAQEDPFMTACAVDGLSVCERLGYKIDGVALKRGRERLRSLAQNEQDLNRLAYMVYVLGDGFDRLLADPDKLSPYAQALLVLTLKKAGRPEAAEAARKLASRARQDHWETPNWHHRWDKVEIETTAYAIQALAAVDPKNPIIPEAAGWLLAQRRENHWNSTRDTAVAIAALLQVTSLEKVAGAVAEKASEVKRPSVLKKVGIMLNGRAQHEIQVDLNNPLKSSFEAHFTEVQPGTNVLVFEKLDEQSEFPFEAEVTMRVLDERVVAESRGVSVHVTYDRPLESLHLGDEVTVTLTASAASEVDYVMVLSPVPAGCEVIRGSGSGDFERFEDRYEKALFFLRSMGTQARRLQYKMRCSFAGRYSLLPAWAGLMYNEEIYGTGAPLAASIAP